MRLGQQRVAFVQADPPGATYPIGADATDPVFQHLAIVVRDMAAASATLAATPISRNGPQVLPPSTGGVAAYKFRDPDGHPLELIHFPGGEAARRWADAPGLFLGIDHSAITVTDLDGTIGFLTEGLGLTVSERGLNQGPEQARLDGLDDPVVDVVALAPPDPEPHVELLHYQPAARSRPRTRTALPTGQARASSSQATIPRPSRNRYAARGTRRASPRMALPAPSRGRTGTGSSSCAGVDAAGGRRHSRAEITPMPLLALPFPAIDPVAIAIGPITIKWYALAYIAGLIGGWFYARRLVMADRLWGVVKRPVPADIDDLVVWVALGVVLGGRIGYVLFYNLPMYIADPIEILAIRNGGMSFHGGFLGAILAFLLFARSRGLNGYTLLDIGAVVVPIGLFFGRIANFVNGELWGRIAPDFPYAIAFPTAAPSPASEPALRGGDGGIAALHRHGDLRLPFRFPEARPARRHLCAGYALARTGCEFFREPDAQLGFLFGNGLGPIGGGVTMGMLLCVPMALVGLTYIVLAATGRTRPKKTAAAETVEEAQATRAGA